MINNFSQINPLLYFDAGDLFYRIIIMTRKKDKPSEGFASQRSRIIKEYYIDSAERLINKKLEIIKLTDFFNARACIFLNRISRSKLKRSIMRTILDFENSDNNLYERVLYKALGKSSINDKLWIVDLDTTNELVVEGIADDINKLAPEGPKIQAYLRTPNGYHLITKPFNMQRFKSIYNKIDVHKNNPTILYANI